jgi:hypothetical protein
MADYQWQAWKSTVAASNGAPSLPAAEGYVGEIIDAGAKPVKSGAPQLWWDIKVLVGPHAGLVERMTQMLNPDNPKALAAFYGVVERLGVNFDNVPDNTPPEAIAKLSIGRKLKFNFEHREDPNTKRVYPDFKRIELIESTNTTAPAVVAPVAVATPVAAPVVVAAPTEPAGPSIEEQIAALQAQAAASAAAPAAELPKGKLPF